MTVMRAASTFWRASTVSSGEPDRAAVPISLADAGSVVGTLPEPVTIASSAAWRASRRSACAVATRRIVVISVSIAATLAFIRDTAASAETADPIALAMAGVPTAICAAANSAKPIVAAPAVAPAT